MKLLEDEVNENRVMLDSKWKLTLAILKIQSHYYFLFRPGKFNISYV